MLGISLFTPIIYEEPVRLDEKVLSILSKCFCLYGPQQAIVQSHDEFNNNEILLEKREITSWKMVPWERYLPFLLLSLTILPFVLYACLHYQAQYKSKIIQPSQNGTPSQVKAEAFLGQIEKSNSEKNEDAPSALFVIAEDDYNGAFSSENPHMPYFISQAAKTHKVFIEIVNQGSQVAEAARKAAEKKPLLLFFISGHGDPKSIRFGKEGNRFSTFSRKDLWRIDPSNFAPDATIVLNSCSTGQALAQQMADAFGRTVLAPIEPIPLTRTLFTTDEGRPKLYSRKLESDESVVRRFRPNEEPSDEKDSFSSDEIELLLLQKLDHYREYAADGHEPAQTEVLRLFEIEKKSYQKYAPLVNRKIVELAVRIAEKTGGDGWAEYVIAMSHEEGKGGLIKSRKEALRWLEKSALKGLKEAQLCLGTRYWFGLGCDLSKQNAYYWYKRYTENPHIPESKEFAEMMLSHISQKLSPEEILDASQEDFYTRVQQKSGESTDFSPPTSDFGYEECL